MLEYAAASATVFTDHDRAEVFLRRHETEDFFKKSMREFSSGELKKTVSAADQKLGAIYSNLYQICIDFGSHSNERVITGGIEIVEGQENKTYNTFYSCPGTTAHQHAMKILAQSGLCALKILQGIYGSSGDLVGDF